MKELLRPGRINDGVKTLDKYEYNLKLEEIDKLVDQGDYEEAANLADTIEWKRVRNVRTLCLISEIYEAAGRLEDSKRLLERAYRKSPVGKNVLYRLVEVTTALKQYDEAIEYFTEYIQAAPHDNNRYILKYKIYRGRGSSLEEQINILEEYLGQEYTERWAYELARLYREAGQMQKCMAACDDLVLWFHSGKYVQKALELKKKYAVLTPKQQQIYEECIHQAAEAYPEEQEEQPESVVVNIESTDGEVIAEKIMAETEKEIAEEVSARKAELEKRQGREAVLEEPALASTRKAVSPEQLALAAGDQSGAGEAFEPAGAGQEAAASKAVKTEEQGANVRPSVKDQRPAAPGPVEEKEEAAARAAGTGGGEISLQADADGVAAVTSRSIGRDVKEIAARTAAADQKKTSEAPAFDQEKIQVELARSMREIISGVVKRPEIPEEDLPASVEGRIQPARRVEIPTAPEQTVGRLSIDDILLSMGERGKEIAAKAAMAGQTAENPDENWEEAQGPETSEELAEPSSEQEWSGEEESGQGWDTPKARDSRGNSGTAPAMTITEAAAEELTEAQKEALQYTSNPEKLLRNKSSLPTYEEEREDLGKTRRAVSKEELMEAARRELMAEKTIRLPAEELARRRSIKVQSAGAPDGYDAAGDERSYGETDGGYEGYDGGEGAETGYEAAGEEYDGRGEADAESGIGYGEADEGYEDSYGVADDGYDEEDSGSGYQDEYEENYDSQSGDYGEDGFYEEEYEGEDYGEEPYEEDYEGGDYLKLPDHLAGLFSGFTEIPELEDQIANAIIQAESKGSDRTSKSGNILIFGAHGSGKTTLAMNLAKAIAQDRGSQVMKMAKIYASDLNKKDIAATVAKIAGGTLIIEEAGDLEDGTVEQLTTAMEFRTDGLIVILEDEQKYIHELLMRHPRFTMKFTAQIYIPVYTVEELTNFGQIYAGAQDYVIGEEGLDALYNKISDTVEGGSEVTISDVIEMVSKAIQRSNRFFSKMKMGKKRFDENDYIILFAKDFK